ncbi:MAG: hypothetical protein HQ513_14475 [Rhodospirillales bacterium]|nr:hypothetical protein [Rhodospirillales bacterium]
MKIKSRFFIIPAVLAVAACQTNSWPGESGWEGPEAHRLGYRMVLPRDPAALKDHGLDGAIKDAVDLSRQKRFIEARSILLSLREHQAPGNDSYRSLTAAAASLSLASGDTGTFRRLVREIDDGAVRVDDEADLIAIYRQLGRRPMPLNTPEKLLRYLKSLPKPAAPDSKGKPNA